MTTENTDTASSDGKGVNLFPALSADAGDNEVTEIESLCMNCYKQGMTRMLLTQIPFFKEVIITSFSCDHCNHSDRSMQPGGRIQERGTRYAVTIQTQRDLNRQVVKSDSAMFSIPSLDFEQPASKKGTVNTVEGLIDAVVQGLEQEQPLRQTLDRDLAAKIDAFIERLKGLKQLQEPFQIVLDDPSGNSFVENPHAPARDEAMTATSYVRTREQDESLGLSGTTPADQEAETPPPTGADGPEEDEEEEKFKDMKFHHEVLEFPTNCGNCNVPCITKMKLVDIPFFKQVVVMATTCDACGNRENEVKSGTGIEPKGVRITLRITDPSDLNRDVLKSDTCGVRVPELDLELAPGTLGGRFTTIEGLFVHIKEGLTMKNPFVVGDSAVDDSRRLMEEFLERLDTVRRGERMGVHVVLDDPAGNSYLQNAHAPDSDPEMTIEHYERSRDEDDQLGLLEMKTENYTNEEP